MKLLKLVSAMCIGAGAVLLLVKGFPGIFGLSYSEDNALNYWIGAMIVCGTGLNFLESKMSRRQANA